MKNDMFHGLSYRIVKLQRSIYRCFFIERFPTNISRFFVVDVINNKLVLGREPSILELGKGISTICQGDRNSFPETNSKLKHWGWFR